MTILLDWSDLGTSLRDVHVAHRARAGDIPVLMVHGVGPGTTGLVNFAPVISRLPQHLALHLIDLAGFGSSGRLPAPPFFNVPFWLDQIDLAIARIQALHQCLPILIGNSVGGALALKIAARRKDLPHIVAIGAPASAEVTQELRSFWTAPDCERALAASMRAMTGLALEPHSEIVRNRLAPFLYGDYDRYFAAMLADPQSCLEGVTVSATQAAQIDTPVHLLHGDLDRAFPLGATLALRARLRHVDLMVFGGCGHNVMSERPADIAALIKFLGERVDPL